MFFLTHIQVSPENCGHSFLIIFQYTGQGNKMNVKWMRVTWNNVPKTLRNHSISEALHSRYSKMDCKRGFTLEVHLGWILNTPNKGSGV